MARSKTLIVFAFVTFYCVSSALADRVVYSYDEHQRLLAAAYESGVTFTYTYDSLGNRLSETVEGQSSAIYEDAEDGDIVGWDIYDNDPAGASIANVVDDRRPGRVIRFTGSGTSNGYRLRNVDGTYWNDAHYKVIEWSLRYDEDFVVYIAAQTTKGFRYIYYTAAQTSNLGNATYIHHGLGGSSKDGAWHTFTRDLAYDLKQAQPDNELVAVLAFLIRGSGKVDDIRTLASLPANLDTDGDGLTDIAEMTSYRTSPYAADTDQDGLGDSEELAYWGANWQADSDGDGLGNLVDADADGDGFADGVELRQGTNPADGEGYPSEIAYEDAEDGNVLGWDIYDDNPAGASVANVSDDRRAGRVIQFSGAGTANGYRLRNHDGTYWNDDKYRILRWNMRYSEPYVIYVAVESKDGFRYLYYTPEDADHLGDETYIHHGLGGQSRDGSWRTVIRDLSYDLKEAQPDNELIAVLGFLIRGSGRVDDIATLEAIPVDQDSDGDGLSDLAEMSGYLTHPYRADTDDDGLLDGDERIYWGDSWNGDLDGDGLANLLDADADNDGFSDGIEVSQQTDPGNEASFPLSLLYEDAEDGDTLGWDIYDIDPPGGVISNVFDESKGNRVIELRGAGTANGYRLRSDTLNYWNDTYFKTIEWSMRYSEPFVIYIAVQTKNGFRYLYYTPAATSSLGTGTYIHHGLGNIADGTWRSVMRDLEADLKEAEPDNELQAVLGFLIRGSGRVDDIRTGSLQKPL